MTEPRVTERPDEFDAIQQSARRAAAGARWFAGGIAVTLVVLLALGFVFRRDIIAKAVTYRATEFLTRGPLEEHELNAAREEIDYWTDRYRAGDIESWQLARCVTLLVESPYIPHAAARALNEWAAEIEGLTDADRARAAHAFDRVAQGISFALITPQDLGAWLGDASPAVSGWSNPRPRGPFFYGQTVELRQPADMTPDAFLAALERIETGLENRRVPDRPFVPDLRSYLRTRVAEEINEPELVRPG